MNNIEPFGWKIGPIWEEWQLSLACIYGNVCGMFPSNTPSLGCFYVPPGLNLQWSAGCYCSRSFDWEVPAYRQLDWGSWLQTSPSLPLEGSAQWHRGGRLCKTSEWVLPGEQIFRTAKTMWEQSLNSYFKNLSSYHTGHHSRRGSHSALWPASEVLWYDWQIPLNTGLDMKSFGFLTEISTPL